MASSNSIAAGWITVLDRRIVQAQEEGEGAIGETADTNANANFLDGSRFETGNDGDRRGFGNRHRPVSRVFAIIHVTRRLMRTH